MLWFYRLVFAALLAGLAVLAMSCEEGGVEEAPPAERARAGLEQAEQSLEQLQARYDQLGVQIEQRRQLLDEHMQTQLALIDRQLGWFQQEAYRLPAEQETEMRQRLQQLITRRNQVEQAMQGYLEGGAQEAPQRRDQFVQLLNQLQQEMEEFEVQLQAAREQVGVGAEPEATP